MFWFNYWMICTLQDYYRGRSPTRERDRDRRRDSHRHRYCSLIASACNFVWINVHVNLSLRILSGISFHLLFGFSSTSLRRNVSWPEGLKPQFNYIFLVLIIVWFLESHELSLLQIWMNYIGSCFWTLHTATHTHYNNIQSKVRLQFPLWHSEPFVVHNCFL